MKLIVFPDNLGYPPKLEPNPFEGIGELRYFNDLPDEDEFLRRIKDAHAVIVAWVKMTARILDECPNLEIVSVMASGAATYVDIAHAAKRGITVCNTPRYGDNSVAEHTLALIFALARKVVQADKSLRCGEWDQEGLEGIEIRGKTLGIIGLGGIGSKVAALAMALGMDVICCTAHPSPQRAKQHGVRFVSLEELLATSDIVSLHAASTAQTYRMIGAKELSLMKPTSLLVNTSRAELVDTQALSKALRQKQISGAAVDVWEEEPPPSDHPLLALENVILTPHLGWNTDSAKWRMLQIAIDNVKAFYAGTPQNVVSA